MVTTIILAATREGNLENLLELAPLYEFEIEEIPAQEIDAINVSSTKIRKALHKGDVERAHQYLGYPYRLTGVVTTGQQLGRKLGFPTANLKIQHPLKMIPANGVYAVRVVLESGTYRGMLNIGQRPTVNDDPNHQTLEVHLIDFEGELYHRPLTLEFLSRMRDEVRFGHTDDLQRQLHNDRKAVEQFFNSKGL